MKPFSNSLLLSLALALFGCSQQPPPAVSLAYANQYGKVETSRFTPCPTVQGVWQLAQLSAGSMLDEKGELVPHFRWYGAKLFEFSVRPNDFIAVDKVGLETVLYLSGKIPGPDGHRAVSYSARSDQELPCVGQGWRQVARSDHSLNDAAARVLGLVPEEPVKIIQTDYFARSASQDMLLAIRIDYEGTNAKQKKAVSDGYWQFLKMPRLYESPKEQGYRY